MTSPYIHSLRDKMGQQLLLLPSVAALIRNSDGALLLQRKGGGEGWSLPAGGIEPGESPEEALKREVLEETGLTVTAWDLKAGLGGKTFRYRYPNGDKVEYAVFVYRCDVMRMGGAVLDSETAELRYFPRQSMPSLALPYPMELLFGG